MKKTELERCFFYKGRRIEPFELHDALEKLIGRVVADEDHILEAEAAEAVHQCDPRSLRRIADMLEARKTNPTIAQRVAAGALVRLCSAAGIKGAPKHPKGWDKVETSVEEIN